MTESRTPIDAALDLFFYAPIGMALTAAEELPKLAAKGREQINGHLAVAKVVGQFAVGEGRRRLERRLGQNNNSAPPAPAPPASAPPGPDLSYEEMLGSDADSGGVDHDAHGAPAATPAGSAGDGPAAPSADGLAIPGYDSLSASQVVQRLGGLSIDELAAVGAYESAHRARRTVLTRVSQLQSS